jgi:hypothetical protein
MAIEIKVSMVGIMASRAPICALIFHWYWQTGNASSSFFGRSFGFIPPRIPKTPLWSLWFEF